MRYCWSYSNDKNDSSIQKNIGLLCCILFLCFFNSKSWNPVMLSIVLLVVPFMCTLVSVSARKYCINELGLTLSYPLGIMRVLPWDEVSEVTLCKVHYAAGSDEHKVAIRCSIGIEDGGPSKAITAREPWQSLAYEVRHHKSVVSIYCTPERLDEFSKICPLQIKDYRYLKER